MIQELFGGSNVGIIGGGDITKLSTPSHSPSPSPSSSAAGGAPAASNANPPVENLRCPRCDSSNTKFCYYNNYNLTQPRHFCKTCRRYWTKGGALRNVPIGGGCRKNKNASIAAAVGKSSAAAKMKTLFSETLPSNPIIWASSHQDSHILSLLRANQSPNPNHMQNSVSLKEEGNSLFGSAHLGADPLGPTHLPSMGLSSSYRNQTTQASQGFLLGNEAQNNGLQELYQRLRSTSYYPDQNAPIILGNVASAASPILESASIASGDQLGFWSNYPNVSWSTDLTTNGAYP